MVLLLLLHHIQKSNENRIEIYLRRYLCTLKMQLLAYYLLAFFFYSSLASFTQSPYWVCARIWCVLYSSLIASDRPSFSTNQINFYINNSKCTYQSERAAERERERENEKIFVFSLTHSLLLLLLLHMYLSSFVTCLFLFCSSTLIANSHTTIHIYLIA